MLECILTLTQRNSLTSNQAYEDFMAYKVKELAKISGISVRTLHYYDEIGLLKPAYISDKDYRYYEEKELLRLQQILFFRELSIPLSEIKKILSASDFNQLESLKSHRANLVQEINRKQNLINTIDKTIKYLGGKIDMEHQNLYYGFESPKQKEYEQYLVSEGIVSESDLEASKKKVGTWSDKDKEKYKKECEEINCSLVNAIDTFLYPSDTKVQDLIQKHYNWVKKCWPYNPTKEKYIQLGEMYIENADFKSFFDNYHPRLAQFLSDSMKVFAERKL